MRLLIAGATGAVGTECVKQAVQAGHFVRALARRPQPLATESVCRDASRDDVTGICDNVDAVISALGAPVSPNAKDSRSFREIDYTANARILRAAQAAGVQRFVYVSVHIEDGYRDTAYVRAHEEFVQELTRSGLAYSVIRPTGIFSAFAEVLDFARKGAVPVVGGGGARSNPVHEADVAACALAALDQGAAEIEIGGPEVLTRREISEACFRAVGRKPFIPSMPPWAFAMIGKLSSIGNQRKAEIFDFIGKVAVTDCVAPAIGTKRLADYLAARAKA